MSKINSILYRFHKSFYEGENVDDGVDDGGNTETPPTPEKKEEKKPETPQSFTQEQVNRFLADERRKLQKLMKKLFHNLKHFVKMLH